MRSQSETTPLFISSISFTSRNQKSTFTPCCAPISSTTLSRRRERVNIILPTMQLSSPSTQIGRPKTSIKKDVGRVTEQQTAPETDTDRGSAKARPRRKTQADEVPMYKVILLGDDEYVEAHVVTQLQKTVQIEKKEATRIFHEAQQSGSSIVCVVCEEHAEFYAQQLKRQEIYVTIEKDE